MEDFETTTCPCRVKSCMLAALAGFPRCAHYSIMSWILLIHLSRGQSVAVDDVDDVDDPDDGDVAISKKRRRTQGEMDPSLSRTIKQLPDWVRDEFTSKIQPALRAYYGSQEDPWVMDPLPVDKSQPKFLELLQRIVDRVCPEQHHTVSTSDILYKIVRYTQRLRSSMESDQYGHVIN